MPPTSASSGYQPHRRQLIFWSAICLAAFVAICNSATPDPAPRPAPPHGNQYSNYFVEFNLPAAVPMPLRCCYTNLLEIVENGLSNNNTETRGNTAPQEPICFRNFSEDISSRNMPARAIFWANRHGLESTSFVDNGTAPTRYAVPQELSRGRLFIANDRNDLEPRRGICLENLHNLSIEHGASTESDKGLVFSDTYSLRGWYENLFNTSPLTFWPTALPPAIWIMPSLTEVHAEDPWIMPFLTELHSGDVWIMPSLTELPADAPWIMPSLTALVSNGAAATLSGLANQADTIVPRRTEAGPETRSTSPIQGETRAPPRGLSHPSKGSDGMAFWSPPPRAKHCAPPPRRHAHLAPGGQEPASVPPPAPPAPAPAPDGSRRAGRETQIPDVPSRLGSQQAVQARQRHGIQPAHQQVLRDPD